MPTNMQKLSKDMIVYSVLLSEYEKPDFKNDALAGVRANYFNAGCSPQIDTTDIDLDGRPLSLTYAMKQGEPLAWKITRNHQPYQTVRRADHSYCVMTYSDNGVIYKRTYFDSDHLWQRTDYFSPEQESAVRASVSPFMTGGVLALRVDTFSDDGSKKRAVLYPSQSHGGLPCAALLYANAGMLWYDARFAPSKSCGEELPAAEKRGFAFTSESFVTAADAPLDVTNAPYLSEDDLAAAPVLSEEVPEAEKPYSAYDRIESILFEAQKTNKNIFGEVVSHAEPEPEIPEEVPEEIPEETPKVSVPEPEYQLAEEEPDLELKTPDGVYSFFGQLDEKNQRTGRGRTVSADGVTVYDGEYRLDKRSGYGVCYYKDGTPNYAGSWDNGVRSGRGVGYRRSDGTIHVGKWQQNSPDGVGARFDNEGNFLDVCAYTDGVRHGKSLSFDEEGRVVIRVWEDGELISERVIGDEE